MTSDDSGAPPASGDWATAAELASMPDVWRRLLVDHVPAADGRCRACTQGGTGIPTARWPCGPRLVAEAAARHHAARNRD
jgi:hypothetical protein